MTKPVDDLEAVRLVVQALEPFDSEDRDRIIRWACEKLAMKSPPSSLAPTRQETQAARIPDGTTPPSPGASGSADSVDIRTFIQEKAPKSDNHLAAVVAYYYHFEVPAEERRDFICKEDLVDACRKAERKRPARPAQVLVNSYHAGLLDKTERGQYRLNSVGENLVAMVLPGSDESVPRSRPARRTDRAKTAPNKKPSKKAVRAKKNQK